MCFAKGYRVPARASTRFLASTVDVAHKIPSYRETGFTKIRRSLLENACVFAACEDDFHSRVLIIDSTPINCQQLSIGSEITFVSRTK